MLQIIILCFLLSILEIRTNNFLTYSLIKSKVQDSETQLNNTLAMRLNSENYDRIIDLFTEKRIYKLCLNEKKSLFNPSIVSDIPLNNMKIYEGIICDKPSTYVLGSVFHGIFHGEIQDELGKIFYFEDIKKFSDIHASCADCHTIMYRMEDMNSSFHQSKNFKCGSHNTSFINITEEVIKNSAKPQRQSATPDTNNKIFCTLSISMHKKYVDKYTSSTAALSQIALHISTINKRLNDQISSGNADRLQYVLSRVSIFENNLSDIGSKIGNPDLLLKASQEQSVRSNGLCLNGVYVNEEWHGTLGLAFVGGKDGSGICNNLANFVITLSANGDSVPFPVHQVTTIHEIGHTLGINHDPTLGCSGPFCTTDKIAECSPSDSYIMSANANSGLGANSLRFSPCSVQVAKSLIGLQSRRTCLLEFVPNVCGNGIVEANEECDSGFSDDICCGSSNSNKPCKIIMGTCSPSNGLCCDPNLCQPKPNGTECQKETECLNKALCIGTSMCPLAISKPDNISCQNQRATCLKGECAGSPCILLNKDPCECLGEDNCKVCCKNSTNASICEKELYSDQKFRNRVKLSICRLATGEGFCNDNGMCKAINTLPPILNIFSLLLSGELLKNIYEFFFSYLELFIIAFTAFIFIFSVFSRLFNVDHKKIYTRLLRRTTTTPHQENIHGEEAHFKI